MRQINLYRSPTKLLVHVSHASPGDSVESPFGETLEVSEQDARALEAKLRESPLPFAIIEFKECGGFSTAVDDMGGEELFAFSAKHYAIFGNERWWVFAATSLADRPRADQLFQPQAHHECHGEFGCEETTKRRTILPALGNEPKSVVRQLKQRITERIEAITRNHPSVVLLLSGGIDSTVLAVCASGIEAKEKITLCTLRYPGGHRSWETENARATARQTGLPLSELQMYPRDFWRESLVCRDATRHVWVGWWARVQTYLTPKYSACILGSGGEWFAGDSFNPYIVFSDPSVRRLIIGTSFHRRMFLKLALRPNFATIEPDQYVWTRRQGLSYILDNPFVGMGPIAYCGFASVPLFQAAKTLTRSGYRAHKLALRLLLEGRVPQKVLSRSRISTDLPSSVTVTKHAGKRQTYWQQRAYGVEMTISRLDSLRIRR